MFYEIFAAAQASGQVEPLSILPSTYHMPALYQPTADLNERWTDVNQATFTAPSNEGALKSMMKEKYLREELKT